ncbi:MAG: hypothetical protein A4E48_01217 [Methanosaeta sp. PtaU1.Bin060]|nr:MAG: hypothetical protein A4E48_01217 [Methanosaeta sp. PtaU1.Bin060]
MMGDMPDIALIGDRTFLFEKLFGELGASCQFLQPAVLGSPFLPQYKMVIIPTGFANPQYSKALPALQRAKSNIADFVKRGGMLTVFGPMVAKHEYEWLPLELKYVCDYGPESVTPSQHECSCFLCAVTPECDGYLCPGNDFETVARDSKGRAVLVAANYGLGLIVASSVHEFPAAEYIRWALGKGKPAKL